LRDMLLRLLSAGMASLPKSPKVLSEDRDPAAVEFHKALFAAHFQTVRARLKESGIGAAAGQVMAKISVALCRYCNEFPVDRAFFEAGLFCKDANMVNMSFFFLNRFLDIADAIDDPDNAAIDNTDFMETDIPSPYDLDLPETAHVKNDRVEEIRDWVLGWSMDQSVQQKMDMRSCDKCRADIYTATLTCPKCNYKHDPCIISGYPVLKRSRVECTNCHAPANRDDWNVWVQVMKTCPWCQAPQNAQY